jgi:light-harvesting complex 1 beta chain
MIIAEPITALIPVAQDKRGKRPQGRSIGDWKMAEDYRSPISGLTDKEAQELHRGFMTTMVIYILIACAAHYLMWAWRPWFPGTPGYRATTSDLITSTLSMLC